MRYSVHIGREFQSVPSEVRGRLRGKLENICAVLETLGRDSPVMQSLSQSSLTIAVGKWRFRYELDGRNNRVTVIQAMGARPSGSFRPIPGARTGDGRSSR
jgi:hypothetical protein